MIKSRDVSYWKPSNFNNISFLLGIVYGLHFNCLFIFLRSLRKLTRFDLGLDCAKDGAPHSEYLDFSIILSRNKRSTSALNIPLCTLGTGYGLKHIGFVSSFNSKSTGSILQVPIVPSKNSYMFYNNFRNSLRFTSIRFFIWFYHNLI